MQSKQATGHNEGINLYLIARKEAKQELRRQIRIAVAQKKTRERQDTMTARERHQHPV
jgi:hypothetical protein